MKQFRILRVTGGVLGLVGLVGCSTVGLEGKKIDYKSAKQVSTLELPPDLSRLNQENRYALPKNNDGVSLSDYQKNGAVVTKDASSGVLVEADGVKLERAGSQRWLVVNKKPEEVWDVLKDFWFDHGFILKVDQPDVGVMETDWAENRAKLPTDFIRNTIGSVIDGLYSTSERDKFRTRIEKTADGKTEIYISHRGMQEVSVSKGDSTVWQPRAADPELEAEFLRRLVVRLTKNEQLASNLTRKPGAAEAPPERAKIETNAGQSASLLLTESFDRSWRRVGLALERVGFMVEDRDRANGIFFVRYVSPEDDNKDTNKKGFFARVFGSNETKAVKSEQYQIRVLRAGEQATVQVFSKDGQPAVAQLSEKILNLLYAQLK